VGRTTTLYSETADAVARAEDQGDLDFGGGPSLYVDKAALALGLLSEKRGLRRGLMYEPCLDIGDADIRFFSPDDTIALHRTLTANAVVQQFDNDFYAELVAAKVYPFRENDPDYETARDYLISHVSHLEIFLADVVKSHQGMISVTA
jgi:hypothetical protein